MWFSSSATTSSKFHIAKSDTKSPVLESPRVAPGEQNGVELLRAEVPVTVLVEQAVHHLDDKR